MVTFKSETDNNADVIITRSTIYNIYNTVGTNVNNYTDLTTVLFNAASNITLKYLTIEAKITGGPANGPSGTGTYKTNPIALKGRGTSNGSTTANDCANITIDNCYVIAPVAPSSTSRIYGISTDLGVHENITISNNIITGGSWGIYYSASSNSSTTVANKNRNIYIYNNTILNSREGGMWFNAPATVNFAFLYDLIIDGNTIVGGSSSVTTPTGAAPTPTSTAHFSYSGIRFSSIKAGTNTQLCDRQITNNHIEICGAPTTTSPTDYGIEFLSEGLSNYSTFPALIANNVLRINSTVNAYGIYNGTNGTAASAHNHYINNTVVIENAGTTSYAFYLSGGPQYAVIKNNIFVNNVAKSAAYAAGIVHTAGNSMNNCLSSINYNIYYSANTSGYIGNLADVITGSSNSTAPVDFTTWIGRTGESNSLEQLPNFVQPNTDLHLKTTNITGEYNAMVLTDKDGNPRDISYPTVGAYEYDESYIPAPALASGSPVNYPLLGSKTVTAPSTVTYTMPISGAGTVTWNAPSGWTITSGAGTTEATFDISSGASTSGTVCASATIGCITAYGCIELINLAPPCEPVTDITATMADYTAPGNLTLDGTVEPSNATNQAIVWTVKTAGTTGASITGGNTLNTTTAGTVTITATITDGLCGSDYTQDFTIDVIEPVCMDLQWANNFGGNLPDYYQSAIAVSDGIVAVGYSAGGSFGTGDFADITGKGAEDAIIVKHDNAGNVVWKKSFGGSGSDYYYGVTAVSDGIVAVGYSAVGSFGTGDMADITGKGGQDAIIVKYDNAGNLIWKKNFGGNANDFYRSVVAVSDGLVVVGYSLDGSFGNGDLADITTGKGLQDAIIVKYDNSGNIIWKKNFGGSGNDNYRSVVAVSDGLVAVGYSDESSFGNGDLADLTGKGDLDATIVKYDNSGNIIWKNNFGGSGHDYCVSVTAVSDGLVATGYSVAGSFGNGDWADVTGKGAEDAIIVKYNNSGNIVWKKSFGGNSTDVFNAIITVSDGLVLAGYSNLGSVGAFGNGDWVCITGKGSIDATIAKFGICEPCEPVTNINYTPETAIAGEGFTLGTGLTISPSNASHKIIRWSISPSNTLVGATVGGTTLITATAGTVKVRATILNGTCSDCYTQDFDITVNPACVPVTDITDLPTEMSINMGLTLSGTVEPSNADNQTIIWSISDDDGTGAIISGDILTSNVTGFVTLTATIIDGNCTSNYSQNFVVEIKWCTPLYIIHETNVSDTLVVTPSESFPDFETNPARYKLYMWWVQELNGDGTITATAISGNGTASSPIFRSFGDDGLCGDTIVEPLINFSEFGDGTDITIQFFIERGTAKGTGSSPAIFAYGIMIEDLLPITWLSFTAECDNANPVLNWSTASENNSDYFVVEIAEVLENNNIKWEEAGRVRAAGNSNTRNDYTYTCDVQLSAQNYYHIKQVDIDGNYSYSKIVSISCKNANNNSNDNAIIVFPNPSDGKTLKIYSSSELKDLDIQIFDITGRLVKQYRVKSLSETYDLYMETRLESGSYLIVLKSKVSNVDMKQKLIVK